MIDLLTVVRMEVVAAVDLPVEMAEGAADIVRVEAMAAVEAVFVMAAVVEADFEVVEEVAVAVAAVE